jgi:tRNA U55 pseudouridine synthase TruB
VIAEAPVPELDAAGIEAVLVGFLGDRMQRPPAYSAVKLHGRPLYSYARQGETVEVPARPITVRDLRLVSVEGSALRVMLTCSRGTYARVLAEEIGVALGTCGHLSALSRVRTGPFHLDDALSMPALGEMVGLEPGRTWQDVLLAQGRPRDQRPRWRPRQDVLESLRPYFRPALACLGHLPLVDVPDSELQRARSGTLPSRLPSGLKPGGRYLVVNGAEIVAVAEIGPRGPRVVCGLGSEA